MSNADCNDNHTSWTDERVEAIKKKYHTPSKRMFQQETSTSVLQQIKHKQGQKNIVQSSGRKKQERYHTQIAQEVLKGSKQQNAGKENSYEMGLKRNYDKEITSGRAVMKQSNSHQRSGDKLRGLSTFDNFYIKQSIKDKLNGQNQTDQNFYRSGIKVQTDATPTRNQPSQFDAVGQTVLSEYSSSRGRSSLTKLHRLQVRDSRVGNIDKINSKIKHILDCINTCEREELENSEGERMKVLRREEGIMQRRELSRSRRNNVGVELNKSIICSDFRNQGFNQLQQTKIIEKQQFYFPNQRREPHPVNPKQEETSTFNQLRASRSNNHFQQYLNTYKHRLNQQQSSIHRTITPQKMIGEQSQTSSLVRFRRGEYLKSDNHDDKDGKIAEINKQINHFYQKINQLQEEKIKLNIQFKPFHFQHSPIRRTVTQYCEATPESIIKLRASAIKISGVSNSRMFKDGENTKNASINLPVQLKDQSKKNMSVYSNIDRNGEAFPKKFTFSNLNQDQLFKNQPQIPSLLSRNKLQNQQKNINFSISNQKVQNEASRNQNEASKYYDNEQLRRKINERMQQRRKRIQKYHLDDSPKQDTTLTGKLIASLCHQVKLDEDLRNAKNWFNQCHNPNKLHQLKIQLNQKGITMTQDELNEEFNMVQDQNDPFFSFRQQKCDITAVVKHYIDSISHWVNKIYRRWNGKILFQEEKLCEQLDYEHKGCVCIEDLVRLLNIRSGAFYRNRDVFLIYQRIKENLISQHISFQQLQLVFKQ